MAFHLYDIRSCLIMLFSCFRPRMSEQTLASVCPTTMPSKFKVENARWEGDTLFNSLSLLIHTSYFLVQITPSISSVPGGFPCKMFTIFGVFYPVPLLVYKLYTICTYNWCITCPPPLALRTSYMEAPVQTRHLFRLRRREG